MSGLCQWLSLIPAYSIKEFVVNSQADPSRTSTWNRQVEEKNDPLTTLELRVSRRSILPAFDIVITVTVPWQGPTVRLKGLDSAGNGFWIALSLRAQIEIRVTGTGIQVAPTVTLHLARPGPDSEAGKASLDSEATPKVAETQSVSKSHPKHSLFRSRLW